MRHDPKTRPLAALCVPEDNAIHLLIPVTVQIGAEWHAGAETIEVVECHRN
jgi:hypothetical protein